MSLVASRVGLRHVCQIDRDQNASTPDAWGGSTAPNWQPHLTGQPCRAYVDTARERVSEAQDVVLDARTVLLPPGVDVVAISDRVAQVTDQAGNAVLDGPMRIHTVITRPTHIELALERAR